MLSTPQKIWKPQTEMRTEQKKIVLMLMQNLIFCCCFDRFGLVVFCRQIGNSCGIFCAYLNCRCGWEKIMMSGGKRRCKEGWRKNERQICRKNASEKQEASRKVILTLVVGRAPHHENSLNRWWDWVQGVQFRGRGQFMHFQSEWKPMVSTRIQGGFNLMV